MKAILSAVAAVAIFAAGVRAQNPIQWGGNARAGIDRAHEQQLPVLFWVTQGHDAGDDDDDLRDAQTETFRDPIVVAIAGHYFVPVRVSRNSRVLEEAQKLGLPTSHGLYVALVTSDGKVLDQIDPGQVANPEAFATRLTTVFRGYRDGLYREKLQPIVTNPESPKAEVKKAVQTVWRLNILSADRDMVGLLERADLVPAEKQRLYGLLAAFATKPCVDALLVRAAAGEKEAASALGRAEAGALEFLLPQLPTGEKTTEVQRAAYDAAAQISKLSNRKAEKFWDSAKAQDQVREVEALKTRAASVFEYWNERSGKWR